MPRKTKVHSHVVQACAMVLTREHEQPNAVLLMLLASKSEKQSSAHQYRC